MIPIDIPEAKKTFYLPESLGECDAKQFAEMAKLLYMFHTRQITYEQFRSLAVYALLNLKITSKNSVALEDNPKMSNLYLISEMINRFFEEKETGEGTALELKLDFYHSPYTKHRTLYGTFHSPQNGFMDVSFGQYIDGLEESIYFSKTGEIDALRRLFAIFYLKKNEDYTPKLITKRATRDFKTTDIRHLYSFYLWFCSMQHYILAGEIEIMGNPIDLSLIYTETRNEKKSTIPGIGIHSVLHDLAESGVFGTNEQVKKTNMWEVLIRLYDLKKRQIDDKANEKNISK